VVQKHPCRPAPPAPKLCQLDLDAARLESMDSERGSGGAVPDVTDLLIAYYSSPFLSSRLGRPSMNVRLYGEFAGSVQIVQTELSPRAAAAHEGADV
jgi:hypothetical protein